MHTLSRRRLLGGLTVLAATGCGHGSHEGPANCVDGPSTGAGSYCLVEGLIVRVAGAVHLAINEAMIANVDESTAVIIVRDANGWFARSAICTHACCVLSLCEDAGCKSKTITPGACESETRPTTGIALCPCHGSTFNLITAIPIVGPAVTNLPSYSLEFDGEDALVDTGMEIDPGMRFT